MTLIGQIAIVTELLEGTWIGEPPVFVQITIEEAMKLLEAIE